MLTWHSIPLPASYINGNNTYKAPSTAVFPNQHSTKHQRSFARNRGMHTHIKILIYHKKFHVSPSNCHGIFVQKLAIKKYSPCATFFFPSRYVNRLHRQGNPPWKKGWKTLLCRTWYCTLMHWQLCMERTAFLPCFSYGQIGFVRTMNKSILLWKEYGSIIVTYNVFLIKRYSLCWQREKRLQHFSSFLEHESTICCNWNVSLQLETFNYPYKVVTNSFLAQNISTFMTRQYRLVSHVACDWRVCGQAIIINQKPENISQTSSGKVKCASSTIQYENAAPLHYSPTTTSNLSTSQHEAACCSTYARTGYIQPIFAKLIIPWWMQQLNSAAIHAWPTKFLYIPHPPSQINLVFKPSSNHILFFCAAHDEMSTELYQLTNVSDLNPEVGVFCLPPCCRWSKFIHQSPAHNRLQYLFLVIVPAKIICNACNLLWTCTKLKSDWNEKCDWTMFSYSSTPNPLKRGHPVLL